MHTKQIKSKALLVLLMTAILVTGAVNAQRVLGLTDFYRIPPVWSPNGERIAVAQGQEVLLWAAATGEIVQTLRAESGEIS